MEAVIDIEMTAPAGAALARACTPAGEIEVDGFGLVALTSSGLSLAI
jgi:hypothetical protein